MFKVFDTQKFLGLIVKTFLKLLKKIFEFFRPKHFLSVKNFKHLLIPLAKCVEFNS